MYVAKTGNEKIKNRNMIFQSGQFTSDILV